MARTTAHLYLDEMQSLGDIQMVAVGGFLMFQDLSEPLPPLGDRSGGAAARSARLTSAVERPWAPQILAQPHASEGGVGRGPNRAARRREEIEKNLQRVSLDKGLDAMPVVVLMRADQKSAAAHYRSADLGLLALIAGQVSLDGQAEIVIHAERRGSLGDGDGLIDYFEGVTSALKSLGGRGYDGPNFMVRRTTGDRKVAASADLLGLCLADSFLYWLKGRLDEPRLSSAVIRASIENLGFRRQPLVLWLPDEDPRTLTTLLRVVNGDLFGIAWVDVARGFDHHCLTLLHEAGMRLDKIDRARCLNDLVYELRPFVDRSERALASDLSMERLVALLESVQPWTYDIQKSASATATSTRLLFGKALTHLGRSDEASSVLEGIFQALMVGDGEQIFTPALVSECVGTVTSCSVAAMDERRFTEAEKVLAAGANLVRSYLAPFERCDERASVAGAHAQLAVLRGDPDGALPHLLAQRKATVSLEDESYPVAWGLVALARSKERSQGRRREAISLLERAEALAEQGLPGHFIEWGASEVLAYWPGLKSPLLETASESVFAMLDRMEAHDSSHPLADAPIGSVLARDHPPHVALLMLRNLGLKLAAEKSPEEACRCFSASLLIAPILGLASLRNALSRLHLRTLAHWGAVLPDTSRDELQVAAQMVSSALTERGGGNGLFGAETLQYLGQWLKAYELKDWEPFLQTGGY